MRKRGGSSPPPRTIIGPISNLISCAISIPSKSQGGLERGVAAATIHASGMYGAESCTRSATQ